ncbi:MlaE family ABC transporter permease [Bradyrhizobium yuanmingense]|uniref:MlaE family ABC transporter permease n=1 Tax=Bradyrhizobium yuanmingense TaxID=108015 RepID=UPI0035131916
MAYLLYLAWEIWQSDEKTQSDIATTASSLLFLARAWFYGGMGPAVFIARLHEAISVTHFEVGILKAPFMALVIGIVACSEGLRVKGSAESLGKQTTTSVVKSIFLVTVLDGMFAVFFASIK